MVLLYIYRIKSAARQLQHQLQLVAAHLLPHSNVLYAVYLPAIVVESELYHKILQLEHCCQQFPQIP